MAEDDDARDEELAGQLGVEPLDEFTRRRLVTTALAAAEPASPSGTQSAGGPRAHRLVAAAAIVAVLIAGGIGYLVSRDGDGGTPAASRDVSASTAPTSAASGSANAGGVPEQTKDQALAPSAASAPGPLSERSASDAAAPAVRDAGDFGDLRVPANVDRLRAALASSDRAASGFESSDNSATSTGVAPSDRVTALLARLRARPCSNELPAGTVIAVATGRFGTRDAIVVQTQLADGTSSTDAVVAGPCEVRLLD
jgi:hypothetical protein